MSRKNSRVPRPSSHLHELADRLEVRGNVLIVNVPQRHSQHHEAGGGGRQQQLLRERRGGLGGHTVLMLCAPVPLRPDPHVHIGSCPRALRVKDAKMHEMTHGMMC